MLFFTCSPALALNWSYLTPNPSYSKDLALAASTAALYYTEQTESANPGGLALFDLGRAPGVTVLINPAGAYRLSRYLDDEKAGHRSAEQFTEAARTVLGSVAYQNQYVSIAGLFARPVMPAGDSLAYSGLEKSSGLASHQNSIQASVRINPRFSFGGRIDRYYHYSTPQGEGYSYGVVFQPKSLTVGLMYQRFPQAGAQIWHPLDRRRDGTTSAGLQWTHRALAATFQVLNLTQPDQLAYLEPHAGFEYNIYDWVRLRTGAALFSRSERWAWSAGLSLVDRNRLLGGSFRPRLPDEILQAAVAVIYRHRVPEIGMFSLTTAWRF